MNILVVCAHPDDETIGCGGTILYHKKNNEKLQTVIQNQQLEIKELKNQIKSISERDENLRRLVKLPSIDSDTRKLGVGGTSDNEKFNDINYLLPIDTDLKEIHKDINYIKRSINQHWTISCLFKIF